MYSGAIAASTAWHHAGVAIVTSPAPDRSAPIAGQMRGPAAALGPGNHQHVAVVAFVRVERAGLHERPHLRARQELDPRPLHCLEHVVGDPDVRDDDVARLHLGRRQHERQLGCAERDRHRGLDGIADEVWRVSRHARRQINGDHRDAGAVDVGDDRFEHALERRSQARAEQRVNDEIARRDFREVQLPGLSVRDLDHGEPEAAENLQVRARVPADLRDHAEDEHRDVDAAVEERPGDHESVAPVVAPPAQDGDVPLRQDPRSWPPWRQPPAGRHSP